MGVRKRAVCPRPAYEPHERRDDANGPWQALGRTPSCWKQWHLSNKYILFAGLKGLGARQGGGAGPVGSHARRLGAAAGSHARSLGAAAPRRPAGSLARLRKVVSVQPPLARTCTYVQLPRCSRNYLSTQDQLSEPQVVQNPCFLTSTGTYNRNS